MSRQARKAERAIKKGYIKKPLEPRNVNQRLLIEALDECSQVFAVGEAGTGKTYLSSRVAMRRLKLGQIEKIFIARPTVSDPRHKLGFLPGSLDEKLGPWLVPIMDAFKDEATTSEIAEFQNKDAIEFLSFEHLRGRTLSNCFVILDEAQNCTFSDLRLFLTRKGENSVFVIAGDPVQIDIRDSGLETVLDMIYDQDLSPAVIEFEAGDVVRSEDAKEWVQAFASGPLSE